MKGEGRSLLGSVRRAWMGSSLVWSLGKDIEGKK